MDTTGGRPTTIAYALGEQAEAIRSQAEAIKSIPDEVLNRIAPRLKNLEDSSVDHEERIRKGEQERWLTRGGATFAALLIGWLVAATKPITGLHL